MARKLGKPVFETQGCGITDQDLYSGPKVKHCNAQFSIKDETPKVHSVSVSAPRQDKWKDFFRHTEIIGEIQVDKLACVFGFFRYREVDLRLNLKALENEKSEPQRDIEYRFSGQRVVKLMLKKVERLFLNGLFRLRRHIQNGYIFSSRDIGNGPGREKIRRICR